SRRYKAESDYLSSEEFQRSSISYSSNSDHLQTAEVGGNRAFPEIVYFSVSISDCSSDFKKFATVTGTVHQRVYEVSKKEAMSDAGMRPSDVLEVERPFKEAEVKDEEPGATDVLKSGK
ncbi:hypothetical protein LINPERHAP1_LOCUS40147, partial [Linum perenne]